MRKLAAHYCLILGCQCGGKRAWQPLPPKAARLKHRQQLAGALVKWQAQQAVMSAQMENVRLLLGSMPAGNA